MEPLTYLAYDDIRTHRCVRLGPLKDLSPPPKNCELTSRVATYFVQPILIIISSTSLSPAQQRNQDYNYILKRRDWMLLKPCIASFRPFFSVVCSHLIFSGAQLADFMSHIRLSTPSTAEYYIPETCQRH